MKNVVVLSGGGMKCSYQVGALKALKYKDIPINCIMGTSGGALNASLIAQNQYEDLVTIWETVADKGLNHLFTSDLLDVNTKKLKWFKLIRRILPINPFKEKDRSFVEKLQDNLENINQLASSEKLINILYDNIELNSFSIPFYFNTVDLTTGNELVLNPTDFTSDLNLANAIAASASIPVLLKPITVETKSEIYSACVDGGISSNVMLHQAVKYIKTQKNPLEWNIIVINCNTNKPEKKYVGGIANIISRVFIDIMLSKLTTKEFQLTDSYNKLISNFVVSTNRETYYNIPVKHIQPKESLGGTLDISKELYNKSFLQGFKDTIKFFK